MFMDEGFRELHKLIRSESAVVPNYFFFGITALEEFSGSETILNMNDFIRTSLTWYESGENSLYTSTLETGDASGSTITSFGLVSGSDIGSGILFSGNVGILGSKTNLFSISIQGEIILKRN